MLRHLRVTVEGHAYDVTVEDLTDTDNQLYPDHRSMVPTNATAPVTAPTSAAGTSPVAPGAPGGVAGAAPAAAAGAAATPAAAAAGGEPGGTAVLAPMSGVACEIKVAVGDTVEAGAVVAVMEAMKLKSPIVVDKPGTVATIDVAVGDAVESGATILTLR